MTEDDPAGSAFDNLREGYPKTIPFTNVLRDDDTNRLENFKLRKKESKHVRTWDRIHSLALYVVVVAVVIMGGLLVGFLILPVWESLIGLDKYALSKLPSEVWIASLPLPY